MCFLQCVYNGVSTATILSYPLENQAVHPWFNVLQYILENHKTLGEVYDNASEFEHLISWEEGTCECSGLRKKNIKELGMSHLHVSGHFNT